MTFEDFIQQYGAPLTIAQQDHVFHQGDHDSSLYFMVSGLLKAYYVSVEGKETIKSFIKVGSTIGSLSAAYKGLACTFNLLALEETKLIRLPFDKLIEASEHSPVIANQMIETLLGLSIRKEQREYEFLSLSAEERYLNFCVREPELLQKLTQNDIARFLGITPVALSRIKKRLK